MSRPQVIGPDGKKVVVPLGATPIMSRNAHGVLVCTGFESKEDVAEREQKYKIQRIRDSPGGNQWIGQLKIKAIETGVDALFLQNKEIDALKHSIKMKYPRAMIPPFPRQPDGEVDYDTRLIRNNTYLQDLQRFVGRLNQDASEKLIMTQHHELNLQKEQEERALYEVKLTHIEQEVLPVIATSLGITPTQLLIMLAHTGYRRFQAKQNKVVMYQTINQFASCNGLTQEQASEVLLEQLKKVVINIIRTEPDANKRKMLLNEVFITEEEYLRRVLDSYKLRHAI
jgi:hypothetical protein